MSYLEDRYDFPIRPQDWVAHPGPGRRFALGSSRVDHLTGCLGLFSHAILFLSLGLFLGLGMPLHAETFAWTALGLTAVAVALRLEQGGIKATRESVQAIKEAWWSK